MGLADGKWFVRVGAAEVEQRARIFANMKLDESIPSFQRARLTLTDVVRQALNVGMQAMEAGSTPIATKRPRRMPARATRKATRKTKTAKRGGKR
jgi:hypothetical protein